MKYSLLLFFGLFFISVVAQDESNTEIAFDIIERVPVYVGCEMYKSNQELKDCMSRKVAEHIGENFDVSFAGTLGLDGRQRIEVLFTVDNQGYVVDIKTRGPHPRLEEEAKRTVQSIPQMIPGEQEGEPVAVLYSLPIVFDIESNEE